VVHLAVASYREVVVAACPVEVVHLLVSYPAAVVLLPASYRAVVVACRRPASCQQVVAAFYRPASGGAWVLHQHLAFQDPGVPA
jgi:hypothetical protein